MKSENPEQNIKMAVISGLVRRKFLVMQECIKEGGVCSLAETGNRIAVVQWGLGAMGGGMARMVLSRPSLDLAGAIDADPKKAGRDVGEILDLGRPCGVIVDREPERALAKAKGGVALIATGSFLREVAPQITAAARAGCNVISIAEELAYAWRASPELAAEIDSVAREHGITVLGTGINPGFVLDVLVIALTGVCRSVRRITARRINDLSPYGFTVMRTQGVGTTPEEFARGVNDGSIAGHVGFPQSMSMIARALGWVLDEVREEKEPIISTVRRETPHVVVEPGQVAGCRHMARGIVGGEVRLVMEHPQQVRPELEGVQTGDYITIEGDPDINLFTRPEIPGGIGTIAIAVNMIPLVQAAAPGLATMADLPVPRCLPADFQVIGEQGGH